VVTRIGTSGWSYGHWNGVLYPPGTRPEGRLAVYTAEFDTVELNASFYRWPAASTFAGWRHRLPDSFALAVKAPRGLTHARRLAEPARWLERIRDGWAELGPTGSVLLVQLAPDHERDDGRLEAFLAAVPAGIRVAVEFRHASWVDEAVFGILERAQAAYTVMSGARLPCVLRATAPFVYVRLHGPDADHLYTGSYPDGDLRWWRDRIREWEQTGHDVFAYFNNDGYGYAVENARTLRGLLA